MAFQPGDKAEASNVGRDWRSAHSPCPTTGVVKKKRGVDVLTAQLATVVFDVRPAITRKGVAYRRDVFLAQRGLAQPPTT